MPSVGMRRTTRVFGARTLRSGRRLWTDPHERGKNVRGSHGEYKFQEILDNSADGGGGIDDRHRGLLQEDEISPSVNTSTEPKMEESESDGVEDKDVDKRCLIVYKRKRKRTDSRTTGFTEDCRYAKKYVREDWRTRCRAIDSYGSFGEIRHSDRIRELAIVANKSSYDCYYRVTCFLNTLLSYMARVRIEMKQLSAFMFSKPIFDSYSSHGMYFLQDHFFAMKPCVCIVSGSESLMPSFSVNIFAIPPFFLHMQTSTFLRSAHLDCLLDRKFENDVEVIDVDDGDGKEPLLHIPSWKDHQDSANEASEMLTESNGSGMNVVASDNNNTGGRQTGFPKSALRNLQLRNSRNIQKRRSSLRRKRGRPPSTFRAQKGKGALATELFRIRHDGAQFTSALSACLLRSPEKRRSTTNMKELRSSMGVTTCSANLLVTETDRCYRVEGVDISLELSPSKQWLLSVTKDGAKQCSIIGQKAMRPYSCNRYTHAIMWAGDGSLKLEFLDKQDWYLFKELNKECSDRNLQLTAATVIPVPKVQEVSSPVDEHVPFVRPESYISFKNDELIRALMKKTANYDMDSDDEEWLGKLNNEFYVGKELQEFVTPDNFELVIDALEKSRHYNSEEHLDEQAAYESCMHLERREVVDAIYKYWIRKRKQKRSALVRVFQLYQPRRSQVIPRFSLRKKRSFKRQASLGGRGKSQPLLKVIAAQQDALRQKNNVHKMQESRAAATKYEGLASQKRQRAQMLMENADLATYKAMMALRIAEAAAAAAAQVDESPERVIASILD